MKFVIFSTIALVVIMLIVEANCNLPEDKHKLPRQSAEFSEIREPEDTVKSINPYKIHMFHKGNQPPINYNSKPNDNGFRSGVKPLKLD